MWRNLLTWLVLALLGGGGWYGWQWAKQPGRFPLRDIQLLGVVQTKPEQVMATLGLATGANTLAINPEEIQQKMQGLPWVRKVTVTRILPDRLIIQVEEKNPVATGRTGEQLVVLDEYGTVIKSLAPGEPFMPPIVTFSPGEGAAAEVVRFLNLLSRHGWLKDRLSEAVSLSAERWVLYTREGMRILLSRQGDQALETLHRLQEQHKLLDRNIGQVDLRVAGRVAIRPKKIETINK
ncbi:MAG: FtsQ-type POTRA domain-containing protein [Magnetococcales bacterium]|nr:FtsQ-type POTRA domain-containing protein [Magnetococcales bacterium]